MAAIPSFFARGSLSSQLPKLSSMNNIQSRCFSSEGFTPSQMPIVKRKWGAAATVARICESMKSVAAAALPATERHLSHARPFASAMLPLFEVESEPENVKKVMHIIIGTERGMCGAVSGNTVRAATRYIETHGKQGQDHKVVVYGSRSGSVANTAFGNDIVASFAEMKMKVPTFEFCCQLAEYLLYETEWDKAVIHYNEFVNVIKFGVNFTEIYKGDIAKAIAELQFPSYEVEAEELTLVDNLIEYKLATSLYLCLAENNASEQASRLQSMDGATKNCNEMQVRYEKIYQGLRKTKITNAILLSATNAKMALAIKRRG